MSNNYKKIAFIWTILFVNSAFALSSSSFLISKTAINLFDYETAYTELASTEKDLRKSDLENQLLVSINLNYLEEAQKIALKLVKINEGHEEALLVILSYAKSKNDTYTFKKYSKNIKKYNLEMLNYIFFLPDGKIKTNTENSKSIFEIIQTSNESLVSKKVNYNYLLFYLSIANILDENFHETNFYTAQIYQFLKNYSKAEYYYSKISNDHSLYIESQKNIAINKSKEGFFQQGEKKLLSLTNMYQDDLELKLALAELYRLKKKYEDAIFYYSQIIENTNQSSEGKWNILYLRGICFERLDKWNLAEKDFIKSLELINYESADVLNYLAYGWLERDINIDKAMKMLIKANKNEPDNHYILDSLAWAYYKKKEFKKAAELMEEVISIAPSEIISLDHLADIYLALNRKREAIYLWKQVLDIANPEDIILNDIKKKLEKNNAG